MYQRKDPFYTRAKSAGYRSRAAFKLLQLTQRTAILRPGDHVVDLGAWPGGWLQVASQLVGPGGRVIGVDLQPIEPMPERNVVTLVGDIGHASTREQVAQACQGRVDVILSDLAPKLSGIRTRDEVRAQALADAALAFAEKLLRSGGVLVVKRFMGADMPPYLEQLRARFTKVRTSRPEATRKGSAEVYVVASGFRGTTAR